MSIPDTPALSNPIVDPPQGVRANALAMGLSVSAIIHLLLVAGVWVRLPELPRQTPPEALELLILNESGVVPTASDSQAALSQRARAGESPTGTSAQSANLDLDTLPGPPSETPESAAPQPSETAQPRQTLAVETEKPAPSGQPRTEPPPEPVRPLDTPPDPMLPKPTRDLDAGQIFDSRNRQIAELTASLEARTAAYANRPRRKSVSASTREFRFASYMSAWAHKVERIGNLNYPQAAKDRKIHGNLILNVSLRRDGSVESVRVVRSSGYDLLDQAAVRIVELAAPYSPFPPDIAADTDVLDIVRTWQFMPGDRLGWQ